MSGCSPLVLGPSIAAGVTTPPRVYLDASDRTPSPPSHPINFATTSKEYTFTSASSLATLYSVSTSSSPDLTHLPQSVAPPSPLPTPPRTPSSRPAPSLTRRKSQGAKFKSSPVLKADCMYDPEVVAQRSVTIDDWKRTPERVTPHAPLEGREAGSPSAASEDGRGERGPRTAEPEAFRKEDEKTLRRETPSKVVGGHLRSRSESSALAASKLSNLAVEAEPSRRNTEPNGDKLQGATRYLSIIGFSNDWSEERIADWVEVSGPWLTKRAITREKRS